MPDKKNIEITKATHVSEILEVYGDIADVMELFGVKRVARYSLRALAGIIRRQHKSLAGK